MALSVSLLKEIGWNFLQKIDRLKEIDLPSPRTANSDLLREF